MSSKMQNVSMQNSNMLQGKHCARLTSHFRATRAEEWQLDPWKST